jgi:small-conductance mechanosensitive channel
MTLDPLLLEPLIGHGLRLLVIIVVALLADFVVRGLGERALREAFLSSQRNSEAPERRRRAETLAHLLSRSLSWVIYVIAAFTILAEIGVNLVPVLAGFGVFGIAVGFGAQSLVRDLLAGLFIVMENQYSRGDVVTIAGHTGTVEHINWRRTVLRDEDGAIHHITHGQITVVSNHTREWSRVSVEVNVPGERGVEEAMDGLNRLGRELAADSAFAPLIMEAPQVLGVESFGDTGYVLKMQGTTKAGYRLQVAAELRRRILEKWAQQGMRVTQTSGEGGTGSAGE